MYHYHEKVDLHDRHLEDDFKSCMVFSLVASEYSFCSSRVIFQMFLFVNPSSNISENYPFFCNAAATINSKIVFLSHLETQVLRMFHKTQSKLWIQKNVKRI